MPDIEKEVWRAERARQILDDEVFKDAVEQIESALLFALRKAAFTDEKLREKLAQRYALLHDTLDCLKSTMETGTLARTQLDIEERQKTLREKVVGFRW